jgi:hypothetical protein
MGVFGTGLYSGDFAMDLRSAISAVARLPYDTDKLTDILCESEPTVANNPNDEDHNTFWLVIADQFAKRGIVCDRVRDKALAMIDSGADVTMLEKRGMNPSDLKKRQKMLKEVRERIAAPAADGRPRPVLKKPQVLLMELGDVLVYPTLGADVSTRILPQGSWTGGERLPQLGNRMVGRPWSSLTAGGRSISSPGTGH